MIAPIWEIEELSLKDYGKSELMNDRGIWVKFLLIQKSQIVTILLSSLIWGSEAYIILSKFFTAEMNDFFSISVLVLSSKRQSILHALEDNSHIPQKHLFS